LRALLKKQERLIVSLNTRKGQESRGLVAEYKKRIIIERVLLQNKTERQRIEGNGHISSESVE